MFLIGFPLLVLPFAIYNSIAFLLPGVEWSREMVAIRLMSGADWSLTPGDLLVAGAIVILFFEMLKSTRLATRSVVDHLLAALLFGAMIAEFLLVRQGASGTFFLLFVHPLAGGVGGFPPLLPACRHRLRRRGGRLRGPRGAARHCDRRRRRRSRRMTAPLPRTP